MDWVGVNDRISMTIKVDLLTSHMLIQSAK